MNKKKGIFKRILTFFDKKIFMPITRCVVRLEKNLEFLISQLKLGFLNLIHYYLYH